MSDGIDNEKAIERREGEGVVDGEARAEALGLGGGLTPGQAAALEVLTGGGTIVGAARAAGVTRRTMYAWLEEGRALGEAYAQWKQGIAETARTRLLMIGEAATVAIAQAVKRGDTKTALAVAKGMGLLSPPAVGPALAQIAARKQTVEAAKAEGERAEALGAGAFAELVNVERFVEEVGEGD